MSSKHRVFSHSNDMNFNDYLKHKRGQEMLKIAKSKIGPNVINYFYSYSDFITLAKVYYKHLTRGDVGFSVPTNILNTNTSFLVYDKVTAHLNNCKYCYNFKNDLDTCYQSCDDLLGILYPYGKYISNNIQKNMYFPSRIDLSKWCSEKPSSNCEPEYDKFKPGNPNYQHGNANFEPGTVFNCDCSFTNKRALFIDK
jgi:hypothetical protein